MHILKQDEKELHIFEVSEASNLKHEEFEKVFIQTDRALVEPMESEWGSRNLLESFSEGYGPVIILRTLALSSTSREPESHFNNVLGRVPSYKVDLEFSKYISEVFDRLGLITRIKLLYRIMLKTYRGEMDVKAWEKIDSEIKKIDKDAWADLTELRTNKTAFEVATTRFESACLIVRDRMSEKVKEKLFSEPERPAFDSNGYKLKILRYAIPLTIAIGLLLAIWKIGVAEGLKLTGSWFLFNGISTAFASLVAGASLVTAVAVFFLAPIVSLDPFLGAGIIAVYIQARLDPPKVSDVENIHELGLKDLRSNRVGRLPLIYLFVNIVNPVATLSFIGLKAAGLI